MSGPELNNNYLSGSGAGCGYLRAYCGPSGLCHCVRDQNLVNEAL